MSVLAGSWTLTGCDVLAYLETVEGSGRPITFVYDHPRHGSLERAVIVKQVVVEPDGSGYVRGIDTVRNGWRTFRLDRIHAITISRFAARR